MFTSQLTSLVKKMLTTEFIYELYIKALQTNFTKMKEKIHLEKSVYNEPKLPQLFENQHTFTVCINNQDEKYAQQNV